MGVIWHKIWFDLWHNKSRTLLAVLSVAAGAFAVGAIFGMSDLMGSTMDQSHRAVMPPHVSVVLTEPVDYETLMNLENIPGVEGIDPYNNVTVLYKLHPEDKWRQGVIQARTYEEQKYELVQLREGTWPETKNDIAIERMAALSNGLGLGDPVILKIGNREQTYHFTSFIRHPFVPPPAFMDLSVFFMSSKGLERFGIADGKYNNFFVRVTPYSPAHARDIATEIKRTLARQDINVAAFMYQDPDRHWGRAFMDGFMLVQQMLAVICVLMSAVLVYNTISNVITQQTDQIGILKAIGSRTSMIIGLYLITAFVYGILALLIAVPLGAAVSFVATRFFLNLFNIDYNVFQVSMKAFGFQVACGLAAPLLAGLPPILRGAGLTVRQAISSYGLGGYGSDWLDRAVERIGQHLLPAHYATALGNLFRRKARLLMTQVVLVTAGAGFLMVMSLNSSSVRTLDNMFARSRYDTLLAFENNERFGRVAMLAETVPGVEKAELHLVQSASMYTSGQLVREAGIGTNVEGIPAGSDFFKPLMVAGRWIMPGDGNAIVITRDVARNNNIELGDTVTLDLGELGKGQWQVVGFYDPVFAGAFRSDTIYAPLQSLYLATKKYGQGTALLVRTTGHDPQFTEDVTASLKEMFEKHGLPISQSQTQAALRRTNDFQFEMVIWMMLSLSVIVAFVGGIALMGALSIGVIERTKEIGVLRAVGARSRTILGIFVMEGMLQGILSWIIAVPISFLASPALAEALGKAMFGATLDYQYNWPAVAIWFAVILSVAALASLVPAGNATRISVRDSLAYA
jgi:putative ABC transport system permease protein